MKKLQEKINYSFCNQDLLKLALTHRSFGQPNNERLEFIGDGLLDSIIANFVYDNFPLKSEGELSLIRAKLVNSYILSKISDSLNLQKYLILGRSQTKTRNNQNILSDTLEALIGAIFLDCNKDFNKLTNIVLTWFYEILQNINELINEEKFNIKNKLQEYLQSKNLPIPIYQTIKIEGKEHKRIYTVEITIKELDEKMTAKANKKKEAEKKAAFLAYQKLREKHDRQ